MLCCLPFLQGEHKSVYACVEKILIKNHNNNVMNVSPMRVTTTYSTRSPEFPELWVPSRANLVPKGDLVLFRRYTKKRKK